MSENRLLIVECCPARRSQPKASAVISGLENKSYKFFYMHTSSGSSRVGQEDYLRMT